MEGTIFFIPQDEESIQVEIIISKHMFVNLPAGIGRDCGQKVGPSRSGLESA